MKMYNLSFDQLLLRYYLMMLLVIVPFLVGVEFLALLSVPVFFTCLTGIGFTFKKKEKKQAVTKEKTYPGQQALKHANLSRV